MEPTQEVSTCYSQNDHQNSKTVYCTVPRSPTLSPNSTTDTFSIPIPQHIPATTDDANVTGACSKEKAPGDEKGSNNANIGSTLFQKLNLKSANHLPLPVATLNSISQEQQNGDSHTAGRNNGAPQDTGVAGQKEFSPSETISNNQVGTRGSMSRTPSSPSREMTSGEGEFVVATESDLTIGRQGKPSSTDGQQNARNGSAWQLFEEINNNGDEVRSATSAERQPGNNVRDSSYAEQTPLTDDLALQSAGEISSEETHRSTISAPAAEPLQSDLHARDHIIQPKRKRAFSRRSKTGCITCRSRRKKCDERKPSCM